MAGRTLLLLHLVLTVFFHQLMRLRFYYDYNFCWDCASQNVSNSSHYLPFYENKMSPDAVCPLPRCVEIRILCSLSWYLLCILFWFRYPSLSVTLSFVPILLLPALLLFLSSSSFPFVLQWNILFSLSLSLFAASLWIKRENKIGAALVFVVRVWLFSFHALGRRQKDRPIFEQQLLLLFFFFTIRLHFLLPIRQTVNSRHPPLFPSGRSLHPPTQWIKCASYVYSAVHNFYTTTNLIRNLARLHPTYYIHVPYKYVDSNRPSSLSFPALHLCVS